MSKSSTSINPGQAPIVMGPNGTRQRDSLALVETGKLPNSPHEQSVTSNSVVPVAYTEPVGSEMHLLQEESGAVGIESWLSNGCPSCSGEDAQVCSCGAEYAPVQTAKDVQEYIFDGGDQQPTVVIKKDWSAEGVDATDTVVYYETLGGQVCVRPTNRVPIYAPRFGAVRQVTGALLAEGAVVPNRILAPVAVNGLEESSLAGSVMLPTTPLGQEQVRQLDAFQENNAGVPIAHVLPPSGMSEAIVAFENIDFFATGQMEDAEVAVLGRVLAAAREWVNPESLAVEIDGRAASEVIDAKRAQDVHVYEMPDKCAMRVCKGASHTIANSGDVISFTIRFDNVGPKKLGNAVLLDSLSPRLEYIEGSQQCSVAARFSTEPNEVGSEVLRWEIESPIEPAKGGVISFDCRVR